MGNSLDNKQNLYSTLRAHADLIATNPQTNSVFRLAQDLFFGLGKDETAPARLVELAQEIGSDLTRSRAQRLREQHRLDRDDPWHALEGKLDTLARDFELLRATVEKPLGGLVFTAHPTFAYDPATYDQLAALSVGELGADSALKPSRPRTSVTLDDEHSATQAGIANAQASARNYLSRVLTKARDAYPDDWHTLRPNAPSIASWVGYDLDGRSDISWSKSFANRLREKAEQLDRYCTALDSLAHSARSELGTLRDDLSRALALSRREAAAFDAAGDDLAGQVEAANLLTTAHPDRITDLERAREILRTAAADATLDDQARLDCAILAAEMQSYGLGTARIHLRLNAIQIGSVIRRDLGIQPNDAQLGRVALETLNERAENIEPVAINFGDLVTEQSTARRQMMLCAQILKHVDAHTPIRFLIAESENPATVMGALYLAKQYGVADHLDISPLFETPAALKNGGRFITRLIRSSAFADHVKTRGQLSVQFGFSDAGRFIGQIAAGMAIERIQNLIAQSLARELPGIALLVFNTHGESIGRGAYPGSLKDRLDYVLSPWTQARCAAKTIALRNEVSFQGGDGLLHFARPQLSDSTVATLAVHALTTPPLPDDPFYSDTNLVWDVYREIRDWHEDLFENENYAGLISDLGPGFLWQAGSRPTRRAKAGGPRTLRAISHNAILQQVGVPVNSACGFGSAMPSERDELVSLINRSDRMRQLVDLAISARMNTSVPALRGYAEVYAPSLWIALSKQQSDEVRHARIRVADEVRRGGTSHHVQNCADRFSVDLGEFDELISRLDEPRPIDARHEARIPIHALHALRQGAMLRVLEIAGALPAISARHGYAVGDIVALLLDMRLREAIAMLCEAFPLFAGETELLDQLTETRSQAGWQGDYSDIRCSVIEPLEALAELIETVSVELPQAYAAYG
ncbi:phosphoenolpyruvate carboxylase [Maricaulis sp. MIT060901]|uniref:phosphoenolpyruvate carboxylase n=1 Tax=Maricaulis sp. MIT060901 TaxID=3096993 RepID=UPI00399A797E